MVTNGPLIQALSSRPSYSDPLIQIPLVQTSHPGHSFQPLIQTPSQSDPSQSVPSFRPLSVRPLIQTSLIQIPHPNPLIQTPHSVPSHPDPSFSPHSSRPLIQSTLIQTPHSDPSVLFKRKTKYYNLLANDLRTSCSV